jgi:hypothetical protein
VRSTQPQYKAPAGFEFSAARSAPASLCDLRFQQNHDVHVTHPIRPVRAKQAYQFEQYSNTSVRVRITSRYQQAEHACSLACCRCAPLFYSRDSLLLAVMSPADRPVDAGSNVWPRAPDRFFMLAFFLLVVFPSSRRTE